MEKSCLAGGRWSQLVRRQLVDWKRDWGWTVSHRTCWLKSAGALSQARVLIHWSNWK